MANIAMDGELVEDRGQTLSGRIVRSIVVASFLISGAVLWLT